MLNYQRVMFVKSILEDHFFCDLQSDVVDFTRWTKHILSGKSQKSMEIPIVSVTNQSYNS